MALTGILSGLEFCKSDLVVLTSGYGGGTSRHERLSIQGCLGTEILPTWPRALKQQTQRITFFPSWHNGAVSSSSNPGDKPSELKLEE